MYNYHLTRYDLGDITSGNGCSKWLRRMGHRDTGGDCSPIGGITRAFLFLPELQVKLAHLNVFTADEVLMESDGGFDQAFQG